MRKKKNYKNYNSSINVKVLRSMKKYDKKKENLKADCGSWI